ncbi:transcriptional regulator [Salipaludibacillus keqinensis]|uniref:Transcriptional regulator n=1 Tax=Salipaludibacillus keqinensis TaxID=2045207 RepID=A0A323TSM7_9BACI|nr:cyclic-di-AMP receptor [Salipaludibacillus keqinensis]PYZ92435.1 transcriptional regulator [Salipaludibacillus keqinensis]
MKLMVCVVQNRYRSAMEEGLKEKNYRMTELSSSGGFLKKGSTTFLIGIIEEDIENLRENMHQICYAVEKKKGKSPEESSRYTSFLIDVKDSMPFFQKSAKQ